MDDFSDKNIPVYLLGDFNLDVLKYGIVKKVSEYIDLLFSFGFLQLIIKPTRCTPHSASILDHVVTNSRSNFHDSCIFISKISDHFPIFHFLESQPQNSKTPFVSFRDFSQNNIVRFSESIRNINWNRVSNIDNAQEAYNEFSNIFFNFYDLYFPVQTKKINKNTYAHEPWMTKGILISRMRKNFLCKMYFQNPIRPHLHTYKNYRNLYNKVIKTSKKLYFQNELIRHQSNLKKTWQLLRKATNSKVKKDNSITNITVNGTFINNPKLIADHFNNFFANVALDITKEINPCNDPLPDYNPDTNLNFSFTNNPITTSEIVEATEQLNEKKTQDLNGLSTFLLQKIIRTVSTPLCHIFSKSFSTGLIPTQLKIAKIVPLYKSGDKSFLDN